MSDTLNTQTSDDPLTVNDDGSVTDSREDQSPEVPDKFKNDDGSIDTDALLKSYTELESRLGGSQDTDTTDDSEDTDGGDADDGSTEDPTADDTQDDSTDDSHDDAKQQKLEAWEKEYSENGELSEDSYKEIEETLGFSKDEVNEFIEWRQSRANEVVSKVTEAAGGEDAYETLQEWASKNFSEDEAEAFNNAVFSGDPDRAELAVRRLRERYEAKNGSISRKRRRGNVRQSDGAKPFASMKEASEYLRKARNGVQGFDESTYDRRLAASKF